MRRTPPPRERAPAQRGAALTPNGAIQDIGHYKDRIMRYWADLPPLDGPVEWWRGYIHSDNNRTTLQQAFNNHNGSISVTIDPTVAVRGEFAKFRGSNAGQAFLIHGHLAAGDRVLPHSAGGPNPFYEREYRLPPRTRFSITSERIVRVRAQQGGIEGQVWACELDVETTLSSLRVNAPIE